MQKLWVLYSTEMWEKFTFYGNRVLLTLFFINYLHFSVEESVIYYGAYLAFCYLSPILGGFIGDRFLNKRTCIIIGCFLFALSQFLFFLCASGENLKFLILIALILMIFANGFFKPNIVSELSNSVSDKKLIDSVFCMYYLFLNLGVILGTLIVPFLGDKIENGVRDISAFKYGFLATTIAMVLGLIIFLKFSNKDSKELANKNKKIELNKKILVKSFIIFIFFYTLICSLSQNDIFVKKFIYPCIYSLPIAFGFYIYKTTTTQKIKILRIFICAIFIVFFWASLEQAGTSLILLAQNNTNRNFLGYNIPPSMTSALNPIFVMAFSALFAKIWASLAKIDKEPSNLAKQSIGMGILAFSFLLIGFDFKNSAIISIYTLIMLYLIQAVAEILISPIGFALVAKNAPDDKKGLFFGLFYLSNALGYALSGYLASFYPKDGVKKSFFGFEISNLYEFFMIFFVMCFVVSILIFISNLILKRVERKENYEKY